MTERLTAAWTPADPVVDMMATTAGLPSALSGGRRAHPEHIDLYWVFPQSFELAWLAAAKLERLNWLLLAFLWALGFDYIEPAALPVGWTSAPDGWRPYAAPPDGENLPAHPSTGPPAAVSSTRWSVPVKT